MIRTMAAMATMLLGASLSLLSAQEQTPPLSSSSLETNIGATPNGIAPNANAILPDANGGCGCSCHPQGCLLRKLWIWATYRPKEHVCNWTSCCNSCQYKGAVNPYLFFLNPKCFEGSGISPTFANDCYQGYRGCATGAGCGQH